MTTHADDEKNLSPGASLLSARVDQGLSVRDVAAELRVRPDLISAIERDAWGECQGDVYARGHIRRYAAVLGVDPEPLLTAYNKQSGWVVPADRLARPTSTPSAPSLGLGSQAESAIPLERSGVDWAVIAGVALVVVITVLAVQLVVDLRKPEGASPAIAPTVVATPPPVAPSPAPSAQATPSSLSSPPLTKAVVVDTRLSDGESWVSVENAKGRTVFSGLLASGQRRQFSDDRELRMVLGNAGAVQLTVNGKKVGAPGEAGDVVTLTITPDGIQS
ncbi:MAG: helix-turn-helix domain-containing protein [Actinomycetota bacterium]